ncbi:maleylpyruvate isomerase family mycothiol-dependent enzyme [Nocardioides sp. LS1]|uniref:maleylpyruvate isomerase family mycothiol-dependent enzyme n=1 Tax=Nocardioides sp. LS1 TaxID=1027620 RepID=UPI000F627B70|nr:maleylpyruvate isomerase family mycothiol-dependent enzyme [Nocardioides sp. LS1]GCD89200.1 maleylpyruvate isomerase [Nocardioides sp. LS1]
MPDLTRTSAAADLLQDATQRLVRSVDALPDEAWTGPSLLPGWTRAHVLAHLTLNAEGLAGALRGIVAGEPVPMYASQEARDADIDELAASDPETLRTRFLASTTDFADAASSIPDERWDSTVERVPGGRSFPATAVPGMRLGEVEIHHVDMAAGPTQGDWTPEFAAIVLDNATARGPGSFRAHATDLDRTWDYGTGGPTVTGLSHDLAWWLTGRGHGEGLTSDSGDLPEVASW